MLHFAKEAERLDDRRCQRVCQSAVATHDNRTSDLKPAVEYLLRMKMSVPEVKLILRADRINAFLKASTEEIKRRIVGLPEEAKMDWQELNEVFLSQLQ